MNLLLAAALGLTGVMLSLVSGCGKQEDLAGLSPDIQAVSERHGPAEALVQAKQRAEKEQTAEAYERLAQAYTLTGELKKAIEAVEKALEIDPNYPRAVVSMAVVKLHQMKLDEAQELAQRLLDEDFGGPPEAQVVLGRALLGQGKSQEAYQMLQTAVKQHPNNAPLHYAVGDSAQVLHKPDEAEASYRAAVRLVPGQGEYHRALIAVLLRTDQMQDALQAAQQAQVHNPENAVVQFTAGGVYSASGDTDAAIAAYEEALVLQPDMTVAANNLALTLAERGEQLVRAENLAAQAVRREPNNHAYADTLGWIWVISGEHEKGIRLLEEVHKHWPRSAAVKYHLGYALVTSGDSERGKLLLQEAAAAQNRPHIAKAAQKALAEAQ